MGCTSSITTIKLAHKHPDIQINVIEPSTLTAVCSDTASSITSTTQSSRYKTSDALQVTGIRNYRRCHSAVSHLGEPIRMFNERWHPTSDSGKEKSSLLRGSQSAKGYNSEYGFCSHSNITAWGIGNSSEQEEMTTDLRQQLESEQLDSLSLK